MSVKNPQFFGYSRGEMHDLRRAFLERNGIKHGSRRDRELAEFIDWTFAHDRDQRTDQQEASNADKPD